LKPDYAQVHTSLGLLYWRENDRDRALQEFQQAVMSDGDLSEAHYNLGLALAQLGQLDEAAHELNEALSLDTKYTDARMQLGLVVSQKKTHRVPSASSGNSCIAIQRSPRPITISDWRCCRQEITVPQNPNSCEPFA
jgi:tetratricopeptide (TPR) repeat protein